MKKMDSKSSKSVNLGGKIPPLVKSLFHLVGVSAETLQLKIYLVGGCVRDIILGFPLTDFDFVVEGNAIHLARFLFGKYGGKIKSHDRFGTAVWSLDKETLARMELPSLPLPAKLNLDFISARSEKYIHPAALPTVKPGTLQDDLLRRDFTLNTLAMKLNEEDFGDIIDTLNGIEDLNAGFIRVLHPDSFTDDPTRLFRAFRYGERYGFTFSEETRNLIPNAMKFLPHLSSKRIRHEMDLVMEENHPEKILDLLSSHGILKAIHPVLPWNGEIAQRMANGFSAASHSSQRVSRMILGWSLFLLGVSNREFLGVDERLQFSRELRRILGGAISLYSTVKGMEKKPPSECVAVLDGFPPAAVQVVFFGLTGSPEKEVLGKYLSSWRNIRQKTTGKELMTRKIKPGPEYQVILGKLRAAWLDGKVGTLDDEKRLLQDLINQFKK